MLQVSGIGDGKYLRSIGIDPFHEIKNVGEGLQDHYAVRVANKINLPISLNEKARGHKLFLEIMKWFVLKKGLILFLSDQDSLNEYLALASDLKQAQKEVNEKLLRLAAEFENFKKRTTQEKIQASNYTKEIILKDILNILDSFERANRFFVPTVVQSSKNESQNHIKSNFSKFSSKNLLLAFNRCHHLKPKYFKPKSKVFISILYFFNFPRK